MGQKSGFWGVPGSETCKKYMGASILMKIKIFKKSIFQTFQYFDIFWLPSYISAYFDITIKRALKKHAYCLIFIIFGWS